MDYVRFCKKTTPCVIAEMFKNSTFAPMKEQALDEQFIPLGKSKKISGFDWIVFLGLSAIWGFSFFFIKKGLEVFQPIQVAAFRMVIAFISLTPMFIIQYKNLKLEPKQWKVVPLLGLFGNMIPAICFCVAGAKIDSALSGIMNSTTPLFALLIGGLFFGVLLTKNKIIGVILGFIGALIIVLSKQSIHAVNYYVLLPLLATVCYGLNANIFKSGFQQNNPIVIALWQYAFVAFFSIIYLVQSGAIHTILYDFNTAWHALKYLLILGILGTGVAQVFFNILAQRTSALFATMTTYLIPLVAILVGLFIGEKIHILHIIGLGVILSGIYIGSRN